MYKSLQKFSELTWLFLGIVEIYTARAPFSPMLDGFRADAPKGLRGREGKGEGKGVLSAIDTPDFFYHVCKLLAGRSPLSLPSSTTVGRSVQPL